MITIYRKNGNTITRSSEGEKIVEDAVWIDMHNPTIEEEKLAESRLNIKIPTREEIWMNQVLNRFYREDGASYMTAAIITKIDTPHPKTSTVTFILGKNFLLTIRYIMPTSFQNFANRIINNPQYFPTSKHVLEGLLEEIITRVAYNSEVVASELDKLSHDIFEMDVFEKRKKQKPSQMNRVLKKLGTCADLNSKINESLHSVNRLVTFFKSEPDNNKEIEDAVNIQLSDINALSKQTAFLSDEITFLLDATLGLINVEQNLIIKIFSVVAVFFLPPTLVSSIYGMNFAKMPELQWSYGYPTAIFLMILCALVPFLYFRKHGWL